MTDQVTAPAVETTEPAAKPAPVATSIPNEPVAQTVPPKTEPAKPDQKADDAGEIVYEQTGDPKLDLALGFFGKNGLDADHPAIQAAAQGDFGLLEAHLASKNQPGWQQYVALAKEAQAGAVAKREQGEAAVTTAVSSTLEKHGVQPEQWGEIVEWTRTNATEEERAELNQLLTTPLGAKAVTAYLIGLHREASGTEYAPKVAAVKEEAAARPTSETSQEPISRAEFARQAEQLARRNPNYQQSAEYQALRRRVV